MHRALGAVLIGLALPAVPAAAHGLGESYLVLDVVETGLSGRVEITLTDLVDRLGFDTDTDGKLSEAEVVPNLPVVTAYLSAHIDIAVDNASQPLAFTHHEFVRVSQAQYLVVYFTVPGVSGPPEALDIRYDAFLDQDPLHRGLVIVEQNVITGIRNTTEAVSLVFSPAHPAQRLDVRYTSTTFRFVAWIGLTMWTVLTHPVGVIVLVLLVLHAVPSLSRAPEDAAPRPPAAIPALALATAGFAVGDTAAPWVLRLAETAVAAGWAGGALLAAAWVIGAATLAGRRLPGAVGLTGGALCGIGGLGRIAAVGDGTGWAHAVGVALAVIAAAGLVVPLLNEVRRRPWYDRLVVRGGSIALAIAGAAVLAVWSP